VQITGVAEASSKKEIDITLIQAIPKKEKMDYIVEKATELGVDVIYIPMVTDRTHSNVDEAKRSSRAERWRRIMPGILPSSPGDSRSRFIHDVVRFAGCPKAVQAVRYQVDGLSREKTVTLKNAISVSVKEGRRRCLCHRAGRRTSLQRGKIAEESRVQINKPGEARS